MNQWGNEPYNMMGPGPNMGPPPGMMLPMASGPPGPGGMVPPLAPPSFLLNDWGPGNPKGPGGPGTVGPGPGNFIGPVVPDQPVVDLTNDDDRKDNGNEQNKKRERDRRDRWDGGDRDRGDRSRRTRSPHNRNNRDRNDRSRSDRRERRGSLRRSEPKESMQGPGLPMGNAMMIPGNNMMPFGNVMGQQPMDMGNMANMPHLQNMQNMGNMMSVMNMMQNMMQNMMPNMMSNMMDQNMMMMQQQLSMSKNNVNQPIYICNGVLLPPLPNTSMPLRRERPPGCRTIYVGGLPHGIGEDVIREIFERFGLITDVKLHKQGVCHVTFDKQELVEQSFFISGFRFRNHDQTDNEATTVLIDYALNPEVQNEYDRNKRKRTPTPPRVKPYTAATFAAISEKIKSENEFAEAAPTLACWLERGECNKRNANAFYALIQASNNQIRRLHNEKIAIDEEFQTITTTLRDKFAHVILQFEQVGKILTAARLQRVSDHFSKQQRRNIEMWLKMTEEHARQSEMVNTAASAQPSSSSATQRHLTPPHRARQFAHTQRFPSRAAALPAQPSYSQKLARSPIPAHRSGYESPTRDSSHLIPEHLRAVPRTRLADIMPNQYCPWCKIKGHKMLICTGFNNLSVEGRWEFIKARNRCVQCLGPHFEYECSTTGACRHCGSRRHHTALHRSGYDSPPCSTSPVSSLSLSPPSQ